MKSYIF